MAEHERVSAGPLIPRKIVAPAPVAVAKRENVGRKLPGSPPRHEPERDEWTAVAEGLVFDPEGSWTLVAEVSTEADANLVVERLAQHEEIRAAIRVFGPADLKVYAKRIRLKRGA